MSSAKSKSQERPTVIELFDAIGRRSWREVEQMASSQVVVDVSAAPGIRTTRNEHLWRSVSLRGREALRAYLIDLHQAIPALSIQPRADAGRIVRADCAGVDNAGSPFDAETDFAVETDRDSRVVRLRAVVNAITVGTEVIRRGEGDPRRYFRPFLAVSRRPA